MHVRGHLRLWVAYRNIWLRPFLRFLMSFQRLIHRLQMRDGIWFVDVVMQM